MMNASDTAAVGSAVIALASFALTVVALKANRDSAQAALRSALAAERALALAIGVRWKVVRREQGHQFVLTNIGNMTARRLRIDAPGIQVLGPMPGSVDPDSAVAFVAIQPDGADDFTNPYQVTVRWCDDDGRERQWSHTLAA